MGTTEELQKIKANSEHPCLIRKCLNKDSIDHAYFGSNATQSTSIGFQTQFWLREIEDFRGGNKQLRI